MQPTPELRSTAQEANEDHWMLAASELPPGLPDFQNLPPNSSSDLITSNQAKVDDQPSGSWSTSTQQIPQRRRSFKTTHSRSRSRSLNRKDRKARSNGSNENIIERSIPLRSKNSVVESGATERRRHGYYDVDDSFQGEGSRIGEESGIGHSWAIGAGMAGAALGASG
ncbi:hypothetical protein HYALB_00001613 [Hymenoscyphus albidus]|uniref:Uncharacterized protein n=1 Tax=Hymenoscyphus albidus TaxID=595503 RepID=A0A9N9LCS3_9HELO|nr:hypothetical protein HYALB_00001613 [Hymenoscyphus albidus]